MISHMGNEIGCQSGKNPGVAGCSDVISPVTGYPWISPNEDRRLYMDVVSHDVLYARNS